LGVVGEMKKSDFGAGRRFLGWVASAAGADEEAIGQ